MGIPWPNFNKWRKSTFGSLKSPGMLAGQKSLSLRIFDSYPLHWDLQILISEDLHTITESKTVTHPYAPKWPKSHPTGFPHWGNPQLKPDALFHIIGRGFPSPAHGHPYLYVLPSFSIFCSLFPLFIHHGVVDANMFSCMVLLGFCKCNSMPFQW